MTGKKIEEIRKTYSLFALQDNALTLAEMEKTSSYANFEKSTSFCMEALKKAGFTKVERLTHKADGKSSAMDCIMPEAWDLCGRSFLSITSGKIPEQDRMLCDTARHPLELVIWSAPTPEKGVDGEIVDLAKIKNPTPADVKGKWIFLREDCGDIHGERYRFLAESGAAGIAITNLKLLESAPDDLVWFNGQGYNSWYHEKEAPRLPVFSIAPRRAVKLIQLLEKGPVTVHGEVRTRIYDGKIYTVTGIIPGESQEEYALMAHIYEPFIADDALGFSVACEIGRVLRERNIPLKKTLRVILSMELYGFSAFLAEEKRRKRIKAALSLDSFLYQERKFNFRVSPVCMPCFTDYVYRDFFKFLPGFEAAEMPGNLSDDTFAGDPAIGIPTNWFWTPSGIFHHNSGKYFQPDWRLVKEKFPVIAAAVECLLTNDIPSDLSSRAVRDFRKAAASILAQKNLPALEKKFLLDAELFRYENMLLSRKAYCGGKAELAPLKKLYTAWKKKLGEPDGAGLDRTEMRAWNLVPVRKFVGQPFCQSLVPYSERKQICMPRLVWALFDGKRNLLECIRIADHESGERSDPGRIRSIIGALRFLEKYGYVTVKYRVSVTGKELKSTLRKLGIVPGMKLAVHSAFSSVGHMEGGPEAFCKGLMECVGPSGTLLMPAFTFSLYEGEDQGKPFDMKNTPSCCGIVTEIFRRLPGVYRSCDPCHSWCAWGKDAAKFVRDHHKVPTVSRFSPSGLLEEAGGWCLTVDAANAVTFMHVVEDSFGAPCLGRRTEEYTGILADGRKVKLRTWGWREGECEACPAHLTEKLFDLLRKKKALKEGKLGEATLCLFRLSDYRKVYESLLKKAGCRKSSIRPRRVGATVPTDWDEKRQKLKKTDAFTGDLPGMK